MSWKRTATLEGSVDHVTWEKLVDLVSSYSGWEDFDHLVLFSEKKDEWSIPPSPDLPYLPYTRWRLGPVEDIPGEVRTDLDFFVSMLERAGMEKFVVEFPYDEPPSDRHFTFYRDVNRTVITLCDGSAAQVSFEFQADGRVKIVEISGD